MLVRKYQERVLSLAWFILKDREEAKDVTQDAFVQCYAHLDRFDESRSFKNWLLSIAYKRCLDRKKKAKSSMKYINRAIKEEKLFSTSSHRMRGIEDSEIFNPILDKLNEKERTAISLKINEGYLAKEIAQVLNCTESTARVLLFNAKRKLKNLLEERKDV